MKIFFLLNPSRPRRFEPLRVAAARAAQRFGHMAYFGRIDRTNPHSMEELLHVAQAQDCARVVAIGGDGTFNRLIQTLAQMNALSAMEIGLVPAGTCNDFLRAWRFSPRRVVQALRAACSGNPQPTDLGELNNQLFLNNAGFGRRLTPAPRRRPSALRTLRQFEPTPLHATWDNGSVEGPFYMAMACNAPFFSKGLNFSRHVQINDGLLDIFLVPRMAKAKLAALVLLGRLGRSLRTRQLTTLRVERLDIETQRDVWPQLDGEPPAAEPVRRLNFRVAKAKAWIVRPA